MKSLLSIAALSLTAFSAVAQTAEHAIAKADIPEVATVMAAVAPATVTKTVYVPTDRSINTINMEAQGSLAVFSNLSANNRMTAYVTDAQGRETIMRNLSARNNTIDMNRLKSGLYFITLISETTADRKGFVFNR